MERTPEICALEKHIWRLEEEIKILETLVYSLQKQTQQNQQEKRKGNDTKTNLSQMPHEEDVINAKV